MIKSMDAGGVCIIDSEEIGEVYKSMVVGEVCIIASEEVEDVSRSMVAGGDCTIASDEVEDIIKSKEVEDVIKPMVAGGDYIIASDVDEVQLEDDLPEIINAMVMEERFPRFIQEVTQHMEENTVGTIGMDGNDGPVRDNVENSFKSVGDGGVCIIALTLKEYDILASR